MLLFEIANLKSKVMYKSTPVEDYFNSKRRMRIGKFIQTYATIDGKKYEARWGIVQGKIYIKSREPGWNGKLSNFVSINNKNGIEFDGVKVRGIEGFLQALKFQDEATQRRICLLIGSRAQKEGQTTEANLWKSSQTLWWKGKPMKREGSEYSSLISKFYDQVYTNNLSNKIPLMMSADFDLIHPEGHKPKHDTILNEHEFIGNLKRIRKKLLSGWKFEEREPTEEELANFRKTDTYQSIQNARARTEQTERNRGIRSGSLAHDHHAKMFLDKMYAPKKSKEKRKRTTPQVASRPTRLEGGLDAALDHVRKEISIGKPIKAAINRAANKFGVDPLEIIGAVNR